MYRTEQSVAWSTADSNIARESIDQSAVVQPVNYTQSPTQYTNQISAEQQQQIQQQQAQNVQYVPAEVKQERIEVQQVQQPVKHVQETVVQQQQPKQPSQPTKPNVQKTINTVWPFIATPPAVPKQGGISSLVAGMQKGGKPDANQNANQNQSAGTLSRDSNADKPGQETTKAGSLSEHLSRLQRGGGRTAPKAKDILSEIGLHRNQNLMMKKKTKRLDDKNEAVHSRCI